jgi:hypothetical protein
VLGIALESVLNVDEHPFRLATVVAIAAFLAAASLAWFLPNVFLVSASVRWSDVVRRMLIGAVVSYPPLALSYAIAAAALMAARGSLGDRDAPLSITLLALWLPLWTLPLSAAVFTWRRCRQVNPKRAS